MRRFVLGDIHGELESLEQVFERSKFDFGNDELIQLGDICDRGLSSYECVEFLKQCKNLILIQGNHDIWLKEAVDFGADPNWLSCGGRATLDSYRVANKTVNLHMPFYNYQVPYHIDDDNNCFVHAGFDRSRKIEMQQENELAWDRKFVMQMMSCKNGKLKTANNFNKIFIGHTPTLIWDKNETISTEPYQIILLKNPITTPIKRGGVINVDTGSGKGGKLTIMDTDTEEYWQSDLQESHPTGDLK